jgi:hypothetical protein
MSDFLSASPENPSIPPPLTPELAAIEAQEQAEQAAERLAEEEMAKREAAEQAQHFLSAAVTVVPPGTEPAAPDDEVMKEIQTILEEHLDTYYQEFPEEAKGRFLQKGREVAMEIAQMIRAVHLNTKRVLHLIRDWLLTIPGVNKFFLEQEAKVKTDRVTAFEAERRTSPPSP